MVTPLAIDTIAIISAGVDVNLADLVVALAIVQVITASCEHAVGAIVAASATASITATLPTLWSAFRSLQVAQAPPWAP
jgi:hypothetical protein